MIYRNSEHYPDPTAGLAMAHVTREQLRHQEWIECAKKNQRYEQLRTLFDGENPLTRKNDCQWLRKQYVTANESLSANAKKEKQTMAFTKSMMTAMKNEKNPWQALGNAVIFQAIKDYRDVTRVMNRISKQLKKKGRTDTERARLKQRFEFFARLQDDIGDFFFSDLFAAVCDLDGYVILDLLNREAKY